MSLLGPFNVSYPVLFKSGGDTTRIAFGKHIQEIERIYGILNALDSDKLSGSDLDDKLSNFKPDMNFDDINGSLDLSRITGNLDASRVAGKLSNANIDTSNVNGLNSLILSLINSNVPPPVDKGDGITEVEAEENGYAEFNNGLLIQWGGKDSPEVKRNAIDSITFTKNFPNRVLHVMLSIGTKDTADYLFWDVQLIKGSLNISGFNFYWRFMDFDEPKHYGTGLLNMRYTAIGY